MEAPFTGDAQFRFLDLPLELQQSVISLFYSLCPVVVSMNRQPKEYRLAKSPPVSPLLVSRHFYALSKAVMLASFPRRVVFEPGSSNPYHGFDFMDKVLFHRQNQDFFEAHAHRIERIDGASWVWDLRRWMQNFPSLRVIRFADTEFTKENRCFSEELKLFQQSLADMLGGREDLSFSEDVMREFRNRLSIPVSEAHCNEERVLTQTWFKNVVKDMTITFAHVLKLSGRDSPWSEEYKTYNMPGDLLVFHFKISDDGERAILTRKECRKSKDFAPNLLNYKFLQAKYPRYGTDADGARSNMTLPDSTTSMS